jgi:flagellar basal-body rod protein FlgF
MDVVANNLANINTTGFKSEDMLFEDFVMPKAKDNVFTGQDTNLHFTDDWSTRHNLENGAIQSTGNPLDVAISGPGFLSVQTPAGERYTRNGAMAIDANGALVDLNDNPVLGESGPIHFDSSDTDITIASDGTVSTSKGSKGKLKLSEFSDAQVLARQGDNYFSGPAGTAATASRITQGAIEGSNVSGVTQMVAMIRVERAYQQIANMLDQQNTLQQTAVQRLADTSA